MKSDVLILGGGMAGLSLALNLPAQSITILEKRASYLPDKTFCYWNISNHLFEKAVRYKWKKCLIKHQDLTLPIHLNPYEYHCIPSEAFYLEALSQLKEKGVEIHLNVDVQDVLEYPLEVVVKTSRGIFTGEQVYDSRPPLGNASFYQHFLGQKVVTKRPLFNPEEVILMDFTVQQDKGIHFIYLLPFSATSALIESTFLSAKPHPKELYQKGIQDYLQRHYDTDYQIVYEEKGTLPLDLPQKAPSSKRIHPIGARGGWMRPSTGYCFLETQERLQGKKGSLIDAYLDKVFLSYLQHHPEKAPSLFFNLFKKNSPKHLIPFLTGHWSFLDLAKIIWSMPKREMIQEAF